MLVNPKFKDLLRLSMHLKKPVSAIDYKYEKNKYGFDTGVRDNKNLEGIVTFRKLRYRKTKIIKALIKKT